MRPPLVLCLALLTGCAATRQNRDVYRAASAPAAPAGPIVFVANGAGNTRVATRDLASAAASASTPLQIETVVWSRDGRVIPDQQDRESHLAHGRKLADLVLAQRQAYPCKRICLLGQSAGAAVVLSAAESLPPNSVDRIVLLSPSVCTGHDLRPALRASREGIDNFHSYKDRWILGLGMRIVGTTEGDCQIAAGRVGFTPMTGTLPDAILYANLRQHPWDRSVRWTGHNGGHFGSHQPEFLRVYVLPLLFR